MSLDVAEAPALVKKPLTTNQRMDIFNYMHLGEVHKDFVDAHSRAVNGRFFLIVTPDCVAVRLKNSSAVRADMSGAGCENYIWLRNLYRATCPAGMRIDFGYCKLKNVNFGDHLEDVFTMKVCIFVNK